LQYAELLVCFVAHYIQVSDLTTLVPDLNILW